MLYLASQSPRRRELLEQIAVPYRPLSVDVDETPRPGEAPDDFVQRVACDKARAGRLLVDDDALVLGADTAVVVDGDILGKPVDRQQAGAMLARLSGREHQVLTGVCLASAAGQNCVLSRSTVRFTPLSREQIDAYIATGEPDDKAGAYAIQGRAALFIEHLQGSYSGVMGLPLYETGQLLRSSGLLE